MISDSRKIRHPAAANHHNGVFLKIMANAGNISGNFHTISQPDPRDFPQRRVWLFRSGGGNFKAHSALERAIGADRPVFQGIKNIFKSRRFIFPFNVFSRSFFELVDGWQNFKLN